MGSLAAQVAHVQYLGLCAHTHEVASWTCDTLAALLQWAQHVDLAHATLSTDEAAQVTAAARTLLTTKRESKLLLTAHKLHTALDALTPPLCHVTVLQTVVCNHATPNAVRAAAVCELGADGVRSALGNLTNERHAGWIAQMSRIAAAHITHETDEDRVRAQVELCAQGMQNAIAPSVDELFDAELVNGKELVRQMLASQDSAVNNGVLAAALYKYEAGAALDPAMCVEPAVCQLLAHNNEHLALDAHLLARMCSFSSCISRAYTARLVWMTTSCQRNMLAGSLDADAMAAELIQRWELMFVEVASDVQDAVRTSEQAFHALCASREGDPSPAVSEFWHTFYSQLRLN
ncbi:hypothetical protein IW148_002494 [Coemansia sp. RSA 1199]|nr:hypothetical protein IW148_002494 [Coemansia sp. RSA 1199]